MCSRVFANALRLDVLIFVVVAISGVPLYMFISSLFFCADLCCSRRVNRFLRTTQSLQKKIVILRAQRIYLSVFTFIWWDFIPFYLSHSLDKHNDNKESTHTHHTTKHISANNDRTNERDGEREKKKCWNGIRHYEGKRKILCSHNT